MEILLNLFLIEVIIVFIIDLSGAVDNLIIPSIKRILRIPANKDISIKPFDCSLCLTFWVGLAYLLFTGHFTLLYVTGVCVLAFLSQNVKDLLILVNDLIHRLLGLFWSDL